MLKKPYWVPPEWTEIPLEHVVGMNLARVTSRDEGLELSWRRIAAMYGGVWSWQAIATACRRYRDGTHPELQDEDDVGDQLYE